METMDDFKDELEASFRQIREGDIITGTVIAVSEEEITLDLKYYAQGIIKVEDFSNDPDFAVLEQIHVGDEIEATVVKTDDGQGNILLSRKEANDTLAWEKLQQMMEDGTVVKVRIKESVPSGVVTFLEGIRAFIPASQLALDYVENTEEWIGKEVEAKVITVDPEKEKLVLSAKQVAKEAAIEERNHKISMIVPGTVMEGTVESLMPYGAFINLGNGLSGLVHISQICERRIKKPSEVLKEGQKVKAKVLNTNDNKISLSMKALEEEMVDTEPAEDLEQYTSKESFGSALFLAIGLILPFITMQIPAVGKMLCPMHIPVLLCGFIVGWSYGLLVGFITPLLRSVLFGMPMLVPNAVCMAFELAAYGFVAGILSQKMRKDMKSLYIALVAAMLVGRVVWGLVSAIVYTLMGAGFTWKLFFMGGFVNAIPGILIQLILIPLLVNRLYAAGVTGAACEGER